MTCFGGEFFVWLEDKVLRVNLISFISPAHIAGKILPSKLSDINTFGYNALVGWVWVEEVRGGILFWFIYPKSDSCDAGFCLVFFNGMASKLNGKRFFSSNIHQRLNFKVRLLQSGPVSLCSQEQPYTPLMVPLISVGIFLDRACVEVVKLIIKNLCDHLESLLWQLFYITFSFFTASLLPPHSHTCCHFLLFPP